jgi:hypothetical protein
MSNNPAANARTLGEASDGQSPLSGLYRELGLAAVANELNLQLNTLEPVLRRPSRGALPRFSSRIASQVRLATDEAFELAGKAAFTTCGTCGAWQARRDGPHDFRWANLRL